MKARAMHPCPGRCGDLHVPDRLFACPDCWRRLPPALQGPILDTAAMGPTAPARLDAFTEAGVWLRAAAVRRAARYAASEAS